MNFLFNPFHTAGEKSPDGMEMVIAPANAREVAENPTLPFTHVLNWARRYSAGPSGLLRRLLTPVSTDPH